MQREALRRRVTGTEASELGLLLAAVVAANLWATAVHWGYAELTWAGLLSGVPPRASIIVGQLVVYVAGIGLAAGGYARLRGLDVEFGRPARLDGATAAAVLAPAALVGAVAVAGTLLFDAGIGAVTQQRYYPHAPLSSVLPFAAREALPAAFFGVGYGLLVCGAIHETVRERVAPDRPGHAVALSTVLAAFVWVITFDRHAIRSILAGERGPVPVAVLAAFAVFTVCFGISVGLVYRSLVRDSFESVLRLRHGPVVGLGVVGVVACLLVLSDPADAVHDLLYVAAFAVAVGEYERTRSLWVPVASLAVFALSLELAAFLEAVLPSAL